MKTGDSFRAIIDNYYYEGWITVSIINKNRLYLHTETLSSICINIDGLLDEPSKRGTISFIKDSIQGGMSIRYLVILPQQKSVRSNRIENLFKEIA